MQNVHCKTCLQYTVKQVRKDEESWPKFVRYYRIFTMFFKRQKKIPDFAGGKTWGKLHKIRFILGVVRVCVFFFLFLPCRDFFPSLAVRGITGNPSLLSCGTRLQETGQSQSSYLVFLKPKKEELKEPRKTVRNFSSCIFSFVERKSSQIREISEIKEINFPPKKG